MSNHNPIVPVLPPKKLPKKIQLGTVVDADLFRRIDQICRQTNRNRSDVIRILLQYGVNKAEGR
jgi:hypothetical protein